MTPDPLVLLLSRLQFALTVGFHYIFVPLTLGLAVCVAAMDTLRVTTETTTGAAGRDSGIASSCWRG